MPSPNPGSILKCLNRSWLLIGGVVFGLALLLSGVSGMATPPPATFAPRVDYQLVSGNDFSNPQAVAVGDFNHDGHSDLATGNASESISVLLNNGDGTFATNVDYPSGVHSFSIAAGDFNNDNYDDLAAANLGEDTVSVFINNGDGTFAARVDYSTGSRPRSITIGDFDNDGFPDMAVANELSDTLSVLLNNGGGAFKTRVDYPAGFQPHSVAVGDFNQDGQIDLVAANDAVSILLNNGGGTFAPKVDYGSIPGGYSFDVEVGDLNNDGWADLATANVGSDNVSVFLNNGDGTFATNSEYSVGPGNNFSIAIADFNKDGQLDLAAPNAGVNEPYGTTVSILLSDCNGTFAPRVDYGTGTSPISVAAEDFNSDGKPDLAVVNLSDSSVSVLLNTTAITNNTPSISSVGITRQPGSPVINSPIANVGDVEDAENILSVTVDGGSSATTSGVTVSNISVDCAGVVTADVVSSCSASHTNTVAFTLRVIDRDGNAALTGLSVTPIANTPPTPGIYPSTVTVNAGNGIVITPSSPALDNVAVTGFSVSAPGFTGVLGVDQFTGAVFILGAGPSGSYVVTVTAIDNCGLTATSNFNLQVNNLPPTITGSSITLRRGFPGTTATIATVSDDLTPAGNLTVTTLNVPLGITVTNIVNTNGTITATLTANCAAPPGLHSIVVQVVDGNGLANSAILSVTVTANSLSAYPPFTILLSGSNVTVNPNNPPSDPGAIVSITASAVSLYGGTPFAGILAVNPTSGVVTITNAQHAGSVYQITVTAIDICGFNLVQTFTLTVTTTQILCTPLDPGFTRASGSPFATGSDPISLAVADFNGDGKQDLITANAGSNNVTIMQGNGSGGFSPFVGSPRIVGNDPRFVAVGDFNGDGYQDVAVANYGSHNLTILKGNGTGSFTLFPGSPVSVGANPRWLAVGDFNGDSRQDLAVTNAGTNNVTILKGNGAGGFSQFAGSPVGVGSDPRSVAIGDFNGDNKQDLAVVNTGSNNLMVLKGNGTGGFLPFGVAIPVGSIPRAVAVGDFDFNLDSIPDLAVANQGSNSVTVLKGNGSGSFSQFPGSPVSVGAGSGPRSVVVGDFNGNGTQDLAVGNAFTNNVNILSGQGNGFFSVTPLSAGATPVDVVVGDFNGDGREDVAVANQISNGTGTILLHNCAPDLLPLSATRQRGSAATVSLIAAVADVETPGGNLIVTASNIPGITVSNITNTNGQIQANIAASCTAPVGSQPVLLTVTDGAGATKTGTLMVNVTANSLPSAGAYPFTLPINPGAGITVSPGPPPTDNGTFTLTTLSPGFTGNVSVNSVGVATVTNAGPSGSHQITVKATDNCGATSITDLNLIVNTPPTISGANVTRQAGSNIPPVLPLIVGNVNDINPGPLAVQINGGSTATVNGVFVGSINVNPGNGQVTAIVNTSCLASTANFRLKVTDGGGLWATANLHVVVTPNPPVSLGNYQNASISLSSGNSATVVPGAPPKDNGASWSIAPSVSAGFTGNITVNQSSGVVTITNAGPAGDYNITLSAMDQCNAISTTQFKLKIKP